MRDECEDETRTTQQTPSAAAQPAAQGYKGGGTQNHQLLKDIDHMRHTNTAVLPTSALLEHELKPFLRSQQRGTNRTNGICARKTLQANIQVNNLHSVPVRGPPYFGQQDFVSQNTRTSSLIESSSHQKLE